MNVSLLGPLLISTLATFVPTIAARDEIQRLPSRSCFRHSDGGQTIYQFNLTDIFESQHINLSRYEGLNALNYSYRDLVVLGIPSNQFGLQEPGSNATEILNGVRYVRPGKDFIPNFQMFKKSDINGKKELPLYTYLKAFCPTTRDGFDDKNALYWDPVKGNDVKWNWEKFLISRKGYPYMRYDPSTDPEHIRSDIEFLIHNNV